MRVPISMATKHTSRAESRIKIGRGSLGGRYVSFVPLPGLRPTLGKVREATFSMLAPFSGSHGFVDLCAGSGIMGFEAFSMGFRPVIWLDTSATVISTLHGNAVALGVEGSMIRHDALRLTSLALQARRWVFFGDPPYQDHVFHGRMLALLTTLQAVEPGSLYLAEQENTPLEAPAGDFTRIRHKIYGRTHLLLWEKGTALADNPDPVK